MATEVCTSTYINDRHDVQALVNYLPLEKMEFGPDDMPAPKKFGDFIESSRYSMSSHGIILRDSLITGVRVLGHAKQIPEVDNDLLTRGLSSDNPKCQRQGGFVQAGQERL